MINIKKAGKFRFLDLQHNFVKLYQAVKIR